MTGYTTGAKLSEKVAPLDFQPLKLDLSKWSVTSDIDSEQVCLV